MSPWRPEATLELRIGAETWRLSRPGDVLARASFDSLDDLVRSFESASIESGVSGARVAAVVHEQWVRSFTVHPPEGLRNLNELRALARVRLEQLFSVDASQWIVRGDWSGTRGFVVTAMPIALFDAVLAFCGRSKLRLSKLLPWWVHPLGSAEAVSNPSQWWSIRQDGVLTVVHSGDGRLVFARSVRLTDDASEDAVRAIAERERMRFGILAAPPTRLLYVDLRADDSVLLPQHAPLCTAHDAARTDHPFAWPQRHRAWPTIAVAIGLVALVTTGAVRMSSLADEQSAMVETLAKARATLPVATPVRPDSKPLPRRDVDAINAVTHRLNTPWPDIFATLEQTTPRNVALLGVEPDTGQARLRGSARAADHRAMVDYVDRLSSRWPLGQARLVRHEMDDKDPTRPLKFQFEVTLQPAEAPR